MDRTKQLILASASPRRRELLGATGVRFEVVTADVVELTDYEDVFTTPGRVAMENASRKARAVARTHPGRYVLGADTVVTLDGRLFGKPGSLEEARDFLRALSGKTHEVLTGCFLLVPLPTSPSFKVKSFVETTRVSFRSLTEDIINRYLAEVHVFDKAGAYAVQERGDWIIERVEGSRDNVIGLPTERLEELLRIRGLL